MKATGNEFGDIYIPDGWRMRETGETIAEGDRILSFDGLQWELCRGAIGWQVIKSPVLTTKDKSSRESDDRPKTESEDTW